MDKYLSIITNFGCHYNCPYCIVKNNNLHIPKTTLMAAIFFPCLAAVIRSISSICMRIGTRVSSESFQT